jgi:hypothetical protein
MSANPVLTASLLANSAEGITLYQGQGYKINLFSIINPRYLGESINRTTATNGDFRLSYNIVRFSGTAPVGLTVNSAYGENWDGILTGTPTTLGTTNVLIKIELSDYSYNTSSSIGTNTVKSVGYISVPITVAAVPTTATPDLMSVILTQEINAIRGVLGYFQLNAVSYGSVYWTATGLPAGFNMVNNQIQGRATAVGTTTITVTARYQETYNSPYLTETKEIPLIVSENYEEAAVVLPPSFTLDGSIDLFCDLQSMALSLDLPKPETVISADAQVINATLKQLVVKPDQILNLNVRFTKGTSVVDPSPATMRFGIGTKIGGPLLMLGSTFTKVGSGASAYFKMRVTSDSLEFDAIQQDYYDEDAVEQINADNTPGREEPPAGLCELEFTTGSGATLATFRSDSLAVIIRRSLLAGI